MTTFSAEGVRLIREQGYSSPIRVLSADEARNLDLGFSRSGAKCSKVVLRLNLGRRMVGYTATSTASTDCAVTKKGAGISKIPRGSSRDAG